VTDTLWTATADLPALPILDRDERCHVCVVGAGIAGLATAYRLARAGKDVVVIDRDGVAAGETRRTSAHLASAQDDRFYVLEREHGEDGARQAADSHAAAVDWIEGVAAEEGIDCDFHRVPGYLFLAPDQDPDLLDREMGAARHAGLQVERLDRAPLDGFDTGPCLVFPNQATFHPLKFVGGLARAIQDSGGRIYGGAHAVDIEDGEPCRVHTASGATITASHVVLATNSPANRYLVTMKMLPYRTFLVCLRLTGPVPDALFWDTADPYHYVRLADDEQGRVLMVGGGDYQTGSRDEGDARMDQVAQWARERFPVGEEVWRWSGQVLEPADAMAFIGRAQTGRNVYVATGDSGQGMTHGAIAALLIGDLILGRENPWAGLYAPTRVSAAAFSEYMADGLKIGRAYLDWLLPGEVADAGEVAPGQGAIMRRGLKPVAVFRDPEGQLHECSAVCTHAGCVVHWNSTARSWDCPCHGSRFDPYGHVLNGPATRALGQAGDRDEGGERGGEPTG
jgi:glycine/D-amino acid oxidase-like deaminating enzyme/nitrite reductase/ring-hydroxylating ferredoxin subunit